jgi:aspartate aminotransferase
MTNPIFSSRILKAAATSAPLLDFMDSPLGKRADDPRVANCLFGNPQEVALPGFTATLKRWVEPQHKDWFAYTTYQRPAQEAVAASLRTRHDVPFAADDVMLTTGAFGGLSLLLAALVEHGDEVIFFSPPWFFYEAMILSSGGTPVKIRLDPPAFDLDLDRIAAAITPRTKAIIVNSAQNPTGRVYGAGTLRALGLLLERASAKHGRPIVMLSDEAYSHLTFDGRRFDTPTAFYPWSVLIYTYGKVLLTPGQRIGYLALSPSMPNREPLRRLLFTTQMIQGWTFPNALMQFALPDLERLGIDIDHLERKRNRMVAGLHECGYELTAPESTFYLLPRSPLPDDRAFCERLGGHDVLCLPGQVFDLPGYFRISITASDAMIDRALDGFRRAIQ